MLLAKHARNNIADPSRVLYLEYEVPPSVPILPSYLDTIDQLATNVTPPSPPQSPISRPPPINQTSSGQNCSSPTSQEQMDVRVGVVLASKGAVQLIVNPFMGPLADRIGYHIPMCAGFSVMFLATLLFAFATSFYVVLLAKILQGVGASCFSVSGMGMLASIYQDDEERASTMRISFIGLALGILVGAPFGSATYEFLGITAVFLPLAFLALLSGVLHFLIFSPTTPPPPKVRHLKFGLPLTFM
ncbi:chromaffin granule amine transporter-like [Lampris incognitus]|uniref:chromaffin granule amine transporter-like n=1 Tax=Lampris incognitus TaxID=2546036 RepID=UPI0024B5FE51|nr:chromaffin granule amine transporter-like [Lampris incognitus]